MLQESVGAYCNAMKAQPDAWRPFRLRLRCHPVGRGDLVTTAIGPLGPRWVAGLLDWELRPFTNPAEESGPVDEEGLSLLICGLVLAAAARWAWGWINGDV